MLKNLHRALGALMIAAACGGGDGEDGNGPPPDGNDEVRCGDGTCTAGSESFPSCPQDCPAVVNCGDGACDGDESCVLCAQDCGECPVSCGDGTCNGDENCTTCSQDCGCDSDQMCREGACVARNPLIESMPGMWDLLEVNGGPPQEPVSVMLTTNATQPLCGIDPSPSGDACVRGLSGTCILDGTRLYIPENDGGFTLEGQVLNDGTRIEYDYSAGAVVENDVVWVKQ